MVGRAAALLVRAYQITLGRLLPSRCRFAPSCSHYAIEALRTNGFIKGLGQSAWRLLRCAPWSKGGWDPVRELPAGPIRRLSRAVTHG